MAASSPSSVDEGAPLSIFAAASIGALARSQSTWPAWILTAACVAAPFVQIQNAHRLVVAWARYLLWTLLSGAVLLGMILMAYPLFSSQTTTRLSLLEGYGLAIFTVLFLFGRRIWPAPSAVISAALGTMLVACFNPAAPLRANLMIGGAALFAWLATAQGKRSGAGRRSAGEARPLALLAAIGLATLLIAAGMIRLLPWAQVQIEQVTFRRYMAATTHYSIFSTESTLGDIARLKRSPKVVMRVWSARPQKLRGRVFTVFNGTDWRSESAGIVKARDLPTIPDGLGAGSNLEAWLDSIPGRIYLLRGHDAVEVGAPDAVRSKVLQAGFNEGMVLMPGQTILLRIPAASLETDEAGELLPPLFSGSEAYGLINRRTGNIIDPSPPAPQLMQDCLTVPLDTDDRVRNLAAQLARGTGTPDERVQRTLDYLAQECRYSLETGAFHSRQPVAEFLFEKKRGYCQYFASAAAVLLRLEGVPSRYVTGFDVQEDDRQGDHYVVREMDAHAWIEAYVRGRGWLELDPTPEAEHDALHATLGGGWWADASEWFEALMAQLSFRIGAISWGPAWHSLGGVIYEMFRWICVDSPPRTLLFLSILLIFAGFVRRHRHVPAARPAAAIPFLKMDAVPAELSELIHQVDRLWNQKGQARPASHAPLEHLKNIPAHKLTPQLHAASRRIVDCFYRCCFAGDSISPDELRKLRQEFELARTSQSWKRDGDRLDFMPR